MSNTLNNIKDVGSVIAEMAAGYLQDENQLLKTVDKEPASSFGQVNGYKVGDTININKPARFTANTTADITSAIQDVVEEKTALTLSNQYNVPINLTSKEIATKMDLAMWGERIIKPAMITLGHQIESDVLTAVKNAVGNTVGTAGSTTFDTDTMLSAREKLAKNLAPMDDGMFALLDSTAQRSAVNARKGLFNKSDEISKQYKMGYMGDADGFHYLENNLLPTHTRGTATGSLTITATATEATGTVGITGTGSQTLKKGDVFTVASVYAVHPVTKATLNYLQQFVVTADNTASGGAYSSVAVSPSFYTSTSGGLQNINRLPTTSDVVTIVGSASTGYVQNFAFHKSAIRFASVPLVKPNGVHLAEQRTVNGITVRIVEQYQGLTDKMVMRADILWGVSIVRPEWICRITA